uniref:Uncharacterized protein n=1 Tax=Knipowitschia caucasica TaxID=637954 RepID=A0AAV2MS33_KNICA
MLRCTRPGVSARVRQTAAATRRARHSAVMDSGARTRSPLLCARGQRCWMASRSTRCQLVSARGSQQRDTQAKPVLINIFNRYACKGYNKEKKELPLRVKETGRAQGGAHFSLQVGPPSPTSIAAFMAPIGPTHPHFKSTLQS